MEGQSGQENFLQFFSSNFGGNGNDSYGPGDDPNQQFLMVGGRNENQPNPLPSPQWTQFQKEPCNYVDYLAESTFIENASGADMLECIGGGQQLLDGISDVQREFLFNNLGKACGYEPADPYLDLNSSKVSFQNSLGEMESENKFTSFQQPNLAQDHTSSWTQEPYEDNCNVSQLHPRVPVAHSFFPSDMSKPQHKVSNSRQRSALTDRVSRTLFSTAGTITKNSLTNMQRRVRIAERIRALQELVPHSVEGSEASALDDTIDRIKFLQLQLKVLSRSRLGGESASAPYAFLEGYGHYVVNDRMASEPLEEMMGKLLETNPSAATQLLESKGLYVMPMSLVEGLCQIP